MSDITLKDIIKAIENNETFHNLHEEILHKAGKITKTDEAQHQRNLYRAEQMRPDNRGQSRIKYRPNTFKASRIEDEFAEFRQKDEKVIIK